MGAGCCDSKPFGEPCGDCAFDDKGDWGTESDSSHSGAGGAVRRAGLSTALTPRNAVR